VKTSQGTLADQTNHARVHRVLVEPSVRGWLAYWHSRIRTLLNVIWTLKPIDEALAAWCHLVAVGSLAPIACEVLAGLGQLTNQPSLPVSTRKDFTDVVYFVHEKVAQSKPSPSPVSGQADSIL
jgi:hypothetical protein